MSSRTRSPSCVVPGLLLVVASCTTLPSGPADDGGAPVRGITFAAWSANGYGRSVSGRSLDRLAATGANTAAVLVTAYQEGPAASRVAPDPEHTPTPESIRSALADARRNGLTLALKPHVDLSDGTWRGFIAPTDPDAWFTSYETWLVPLAALGESEGVTLLIVGTELAGTLEHEQAWRDLIARVRDVFSGKLTYAASWDEAGSVPFWDALDYVGIDFYFPVMRRPNAGRSEILAAWQPWLARLSGLHARTNRPVLLTEIGYRSIDGAGLRPYAFAGDAPIDLGEQADLYWAALQAVGSAPYIHGMFWWNWLADGRGGGSDDDYTPLGKDAEEELHAAWH